MDFHKDKAAISQKAILFNLHGEILFLQRSADDFTRPNGLDFPGGGLSEMEDPVGGVLREIQEETGLAATDLEPVATKSFRLSDNCWTVLIMYKGFVDSKIVKISSEHQSFLWLTKKQALESSLPESYKKFLSDLEFIG